MGLKLANILLIFFLLDRKHVKPHVHTDVIGRGDPSLKSTEYSNTYKQHPIHMRESFKPNQEALQGGQFEDRTTNR